MAIKLQTTRLEDPLLSRYCLKNFKHVNTMPSTCSIHIQLQYHAGAMPSPVLKN